MGINMRLWNKLKLAFRPNLAIGKGAASEISTNFGCVAIGDNVLVEGDYMFIMKTPSVTIRKKMTPSEHKAFFYAMKDIMNGAEISGDI